MVTNILDLSIYNAIYHLQVSCCALLTEYAICQSRFQSPRVIGQRQDTELWNNPFQESKIFGLPVSRSMRALALKRRPEVKSMWIRSTKAFNTHSHRLYL